MEPLDNNINNLTQDGNIRHVEINLDALALCLNHAFSSESEEVLGLLIGQIDESQRKANIKSTLPLTRSNTNSECVEFLSDHFIVGGIHTAKLSKKSGESMLVIGWYHSHPRKAVWPTTADVERQAQYQCVEPSFFGLIFSVYNGSCTIDTMNICCFQTFKQNPDTVKRRCIDVTIQPTKFNFYNLEGYIYLPQLLWEERLKAYIEPSNEELDTFEILEKDSSTTVELINIMNAITRPLLWSLEERLKITKMRVRQLRGLRNFLEQI